jgi:isopentenyl diphosphate isomerase/L-lactate dehydrogenase-like FMN-dependent dehydrogenase
MTRIAKAACIADLARLAERRLPSFVFNYIAGGAGEERGVLRNEAAFGRVLFNARRLAGPAAPSTVTLFGRTYGQGFGIAPIGMTNLAAPGGDLILARLAERETIPYVLSTAGTTGIEDVAAAAPHAWFQLYMSRDEAITSDMVRRAWDAGMRVLVLTVDVPAPSRRNRGIRDGFSLPFHFTARVIADLLAHPSWSLATARAGMPTLATYAHYARSSNIEVVGQFISQLNKHGLSWDDLDAIRAQWQGTLVVKGVLDPEDAILMVGRGVDGIWVSNHGGRQLESAEASLDALARVRAALGPSVPILFDGGIRSGEDVIKARALGADMAFSGRCFAYGLGAGGAPGADKAFEILAKEVIAALHQIGCPSLAAATRSILADGDGAAASRS